MCLPMLPTTVARPAARRDTWDDDRAAFVVRDGDYVSARWPGDAYTFAKIFAAQLPRAIA